MSPVVAKCQQCSKPIAVGDRTTICAFGISTAKGVDTKSTAVLCGECTGVAFQALAARALRQTDT